jgi:hypothetical protein
VERQKRQKGETGDGKCRQQGRAEERGQRQWKVEMAVQAAAVMTAAMAVRAVRRVGQGARSKETGGGGKEGVVLGVLT